MQEIGKIVLHDDGTYEFIQPEPEPEEEFQVRHRRALPQADDPTLVAHWVFT